MPAVYNTEDLTKRAQIIDSAIRIIAQDGVQATVRSIAAAADVSPALITHHFGSKDALKTACDIEVMHRYNQLKMAGIMNPLVSINQVFADSDEVSVMVAYLLQTLLGGGPAAQALMDRLLEQMREVMQAAQVAGTIKPSRNEEARLRYLATSMIGAALINFILNPPADPTQAFDLGMGSAENLLAEVEVLTEGIFRDHSVLDAVAAKMGNLQQPKEG
ncbi:MAG: TetR family transcriptional regulator [Actinomycetia bacterium]|nr:TetR family transcriptional regulator [Actinomycetes bacterium]